MVRTIEAYGGPVAVAVPVRDEAEHIGDCLRALDAQTDAQIDHIVLCVNNTEDGSASVARDVKLRSGTRLHVLEPQLPPSQANAGHARRLAMDLAANLTGERGVVMTTDADAVADHDWLRENLAALRRGADAVAGWVDLKPEDWRNIPMALHEDDARECAYDRLCDDIHAYLDPDPADPLPRHTQHSGASIAVTASMYRLAGGMPAVRVGEDRAFLTALRQVDARIRHAPECHVVVSGRMVGRAAGGMADTIRRRMAAPDLFLDDRLEPAVDCARRARLRRRLRECLADHALVGGFARETGLEASWVEQLLIGGSLGRAWTKIEGSSKILQRRRVAVADLTEQMAQAEAICASLRPVGGVAALLETLEAAE